ncbi:MAG: hypothetical protein RIT14_1838 [Pseudomonadota bacterium]
MTKKPTPTPGPATPGPAPVEGERIAKVLSRAGIASRREAERMIAAGEVAVNGKVIDSPALNVTPRDRVTVKGQTLAAPEPARLWLYYKPEGLVTSASDEKGRPTVFDTLPEDMPRVMSVGRLDLNSEGLLLLTNDGELKRRLELPSTGWLRKYRVRVKGNPTDPDLEPLRRGITIDGEAFQPMSVMLDRHQGANAWLTIGLREGRNREIRRAINAIGLIVNRLIRISYGPFRLNEMKPGEVEEIRPKVLREQLGLTGEASDGFEDRPRKPGPTRSGTRPAKTATGGASGKTFIPRGATLLDSPAVKPPRARPAAPAADRSGGKPAQGRSFTSKSAAPGGSGEAGKSAGAAPPGAGRSFAAKPAASGGRAETGKSATAGRPPRPFAKAPGAPGAPGAPRAGRTTPAKPGPRPGPGPGTSSGPRPPRKPRG